MLWPKNITWSGYLTVVKSTEVWRSYYNTLWYTGVGTAINVSITLMVGYPLSRRAFRGRRLLMFYIAFTMWFSGGIIPTFIIVRDLGRYATRWAMVLPTAAAAWNAEQHRRLDPGVGQDRRRHRCLGVCRIGRTEEAKECWSGLRSDYRLHESMLSQIVELGYPLPQT